MCLAVLFSVSSAARLAATLFLRKKYMYRIYLYLFLLFCLALVFCVCSSYATLRSVFCLFCSALAEAWSQVWGDTSVRKPQPPSMLSPSYSSTYRTD